MIGLLSVLDGEIEPLAKHTPSQSLALFNAYWCAYFFAPLLAGYWILTRFGFKPTFITGLSGVHGRGYSLLALICTTLLSGVLHQQLYCRTGICAARSRCESLHRSRWPGTSHGGTAQFLARPASDWLRLSPLLATGVLFNDVERLGLFNTQWAYLAVALWASLLGLCFYYVPLSEAPDEAIEAVARRRVIAGKPHKWQRVWRCRIIYLVTITAIVLMWLYVGVQEQLEYFWVPLMQEARPG